MDMYNIIAHLLKQTLQKNSEFWVVTFENRIQKKTFFVQITGTILTLFILFERNTFLFSL